LIHIYFFIRKYKVLVDKNQFLIMIAVILAGRQEKYFDIPVSLIELVNGVTLLKRTINLVSSQKLAHN